VKLLFWICAILCGLSAVLVWTLVGDDKSGDVRSMAPTRSAAGELPSRLPPDAARRPSATPGTSLPSREGSRAVSTAPPNDELKRRRRAHNESPLWFKALAESPDELVVRTSFEPPNVTARDSAGELHRLYRNSRGHLVYRDPDGAEITVQRDHALGRFAMATGANATVHVVWYERDSKWLRYECRDAEGKRLGETKALRSMDDVSSLTIAEEAGELVIRYDTGGAARVARLRLDGSGIWTYGPGG